MRKLNSDEARFALTSKLAIFASYYRPHLVLFLADLFCALMTAVIGIAYPLITRYALQNLLPTKEFVQFFTVMGAAVLAYILQAGMDYFVTYWGHGIGVKIEADMRSSLFSHLQELSFDFYDTNRTGHIISHVTSDLFEITELAHHGPEELFISVITFVGSFAVLFTINWRLTLILLLLVPFTLLFILTQHRRMTRASREVKEQTAGINADIESSISGVRTAKAFANEDYEVDKFQAGNERFKRSKRSFYSSMALFHSGMDMFINLFSVAAILVGGYLIMRGGLDAIDLLIFSMYIASFVKPIRSLVQLVEMYVSGMAGFTRFVELMRMKPAIVDKANAIELSAPKGDIRLEDVTFSYGDEHNVLEHVTLHVPAKKTLALVGPSGGGKTTLGQLIPRFYDVSKGQVLVDGTDVRDLTLASLRQAVGIVTQDVFLFAGTIRENISYGDIRRDEKAVIEAARKARIYDFISELPDGFDTEVGERGVRLSGGQKQRISIARIFLKNPPILILDEATSSLDSVTEHLIQESFDELSENRTTIIIAHRLSTVRRADEIVYIDEEGIREIGSHEDLLAQNGKYASLYRLQFEGQE